MKRWLVALIVLLLGRGRRRRRLPPGESALPTEPPRSPGGELLVAVLLVVAAGAASAFVVVYALSADTQLLGLALGGAFALVAAAFFVVAKRLVPQEETDEPYPEPVHPDEQYEAAQIFEESAGSLTRKRLLTVAVGAAGTALAVAVVTPLASLGPILDTDRLYRSPWRRGRRWRTGRPPASSRSTTWPTARRGSSPTASRSRSAAENACATSTRRTSRMAGRPG